MSKKRLQHCADVFCHMFCGWNLFSSYPALEQLGTGELSINILTGACTHNGTAVATPPVVLAIQDWLRGDLAANNLALDSLREASLKASLTLSRIPRRDRVTRDQHFANGIHLGPDEFIRC